MQSSETHIQHSPYNVLAQEQIAPVLRLSFIRRIAANLCTTSVLLTGVAIIESNNSEPAYAEVAVTQQTYDA